MIWIRNKTYVGAERRSSLYDMCYEPNDKALPVVLFAHGYKGFKDWGCWDLVAEAFAKAGFLFVKFNFSHNGGTINDPIDFHDLDAFGRNRFTYELRDLNIMTDLLTQMSEINGVKLIHDKINVIGHSRGGGMVVLHAAQSNKVNRFVTWAGVSDFKTRFPVDISNWEKMGVTYIENARTKQQMPHYFSFYEDFRNHFKQLDIPSLASTINQKGLIVGGQLDDVVKSVEIENMHKLIINSTLFLVPNANHTFNAKHPWAETQMPDSLNVVVQKSISFFKN